MEDIDYESSPFSVLSMKLGYKDGLSYQFFARLADNEGFLYRRSETAILIQGQFLVSSFYVETGRKYSSSLFLILWDYADSEITSFRNLSQRRPVLLIPSQSYQDFGIFQIAVADRGLSFKKKVNWSPYFLFVILEAL